LKYAGAIAVLNLKETHSFKLEVVPPYSFELTVHKPAGWWWSTPAEVFEDATCWTATRFRNLLIGLRLESTGTLQKPRVQCTVFSKAELSHLMKQDITRLIKRALRAEEDLTEFYKLAEKDNILSAVVKDLYGMRTVAWPELFPALILAVTLQMAPLKRSNQMMDLLIEHFGNEARFDGKTIRYWPSPEKITATTTDALKAKAKLGYRAANLVSIAKTLKQGFPSMDDLWEMGPEEAKERLLTLRGIGDYSADIVVPGMGFPLDVWSAKIFHILFFGREPENPRETIQILKTTAEKRWGRWRGYAFVYILNDLPRISEKAGFDLTSL
jgi:DNA-3-methyladenine glycosylase II